MFETKKKSKKNKNNVFFDQKIVLKKILYIQKIRKNLRSLPAKLIYKGVCEISGKSIDWFLSSILYCAPQFFRSVSLKFMSYKLNFKNFLILFFSNTLLKSCSLV